MGGAGRIRVGTSGWSYRGWVGRFYPTGLHQGQWAAYYRTRFPAVEINATFYRLPTPAMVRRWHDDAPRGFRYAVKGSRLVTHIHRLDADDGGALAAFLERIAPLGAYCGVVLWQLPPSLHRDDGLLDSFLGRLPRRLGSAPLRHAVEFRHPSWFDGEVFTLLRHHRAALVWVSSRQVPWVPERTCELVYVRFHGLSGGYAHDYTAEELTPAAEALRAAARAGCEGYAFFNNDAEARAPANAELLIRMLGEVAYPWRVSGSSRSRRPPG